MVKQQPTLTLPSGVQPPPEDRFDEALDDLAFMINLFIKRKADGINPRILRRTILAQVVELSGQIQEQKP